MGAGPQSRFSKIRKERGMKNTLKKPCRPRYHFAVEFLIFLW